MNSGQLGTALILGALIGAPLFAQEQVGTETVEELYLESQIMEEIIGLEADQIDRDVKLIAIEDIEKMIADGQVTENDRNIIGILQSLGTQGAHNLVTEEGHVINGYPQVRRDAVRLLGEIGGDHARDAILAVLRNEEDSLVISDALVSLSKVGLDEKGEAIAALVSLMSSQSAHKKDSHVANAFILTVENLDRSNNGFYDRRICQELMKISDRRSGYVNDIRERAFKLLKRLQGV